MGGPSISRETNPSDSGGIISGSVTGSNANKLEEHSSCGWVVKLNSWPPSIPWPRGGGPAIKVYGGWSTYQVEHLGGLCSLLGWRWLFSTLVSSNPGTSLLRWAKNRMITGKSMNAIKKDPAHQCSVVHALPYHQRTVLSQ